MPSITLGDNVFDFANIDIKLALVLFSALVISLTVHEFAHAYVADKLGDRTPGEHGRLTLNPMVLFKAHPFGSLIVPLLAAMNGFMIGWAATPVNPTRVRRTITLRKAEFLISAAGPASNVLLGLLSAGIFMALVAAKSPSLLPLVDLARFMVIANVILALLNLMPIPPLDGFTVLRTSAPNSPALPFIEQHQLILLIVFFMFAGDIFYPVMLFVHQQLEWLRMLAM